MFIGQVAKRRQQLRLQSTSAANAEAVSHHPKPSGNQGHSGNMPPRQQSSSSNAVSGSWSVWQRAWLSLKIRAPSRTQEGES
jgi:hypothetical protein